MTERIDSTVEQLEAEAEIARLREELRWIPVEERLPENNTFVFALLKDWQKSYLCEFKESTRAYFLEQFSHWMARPEYPRKA